MKLTIYLMRESVTNPADVMSQDKMVSKGWEPVTAKDSLGFGCAAWIQKNKATRPKWIDFLGAGFDLNAPKIKNSYNSFVLALRASGRVFAFTFGYGFNVLDREVVEPDFGLRVSLNAMPGEKLDTIATRTTDRITKQTQMHLNTERPVVEFGIVPEVDWVRSVRRTVRLDQIDGKIQGADSIQINWKSDIRSLRKCCSQLLGLYKSGVYKEHFGFIDHLVKLKDGDPQIATLSQSVRTMVQARDKTQISVALVDAPTPEVHHYRVWSGHDGIDLPEMELGAVYHWMDDVEQARGGALNLERVSVQPKDGQENPAGKRRALWDYFVAHVERGGHTYILSLGDWFRTDRDFLKDLRRRIDDVEDVTGLYNLPVWKSGVSEGNYNLEVSTSKQWLRVDKKPYSFFGKYANRIECADILTEHQDFIHTKSASSSATLSHLFSQGIVSAELFRTDKAYRSKVASDWNSALEARLGRSFDVDKDDMRVVFAIGTSKPGKLSETLFFFSLVNLDRYVRALRAMRWRPALCRIEKEE